MRKILLLGSSFSFIISFSQVGINNPNPKATLDVMGMAFDNTKLDGIIFPRITGDQLLTKAYTIEQTGAMVYVTAPATNLVGQVINVKNEGPYYFDGNVWVSGKETFSEQDGVIGNEVLNATVNSGLIRAGSGTEAAPYTLGLINGSANGQVMTWNGTSWLPANIAASNGINASANNIKLGGALNQLTTITNNGNILRFTGSAASTTFAADGDVGIGTLSPLSRLHIVSPDFGAYSGFRIEDNSGTNAAYFTITPGYLGSTACGTCVTLDYGGAGTIGFTDQIAPTLDNNWSNGTASLRWRAIYAANGTIQTSDIRLKKDIQDSHYGLTSVLKMRPVEYNWKDGKGKHMVGFIAQEMERIVPEAVDIPKSKDEYYGMNYNQLIPVLAKAIQEQQDVLNRQSDEIKSLKIKIGAQEDINNKLLLQINEIKTKVL